MSGPTPGPWTIKWDFNVFGPDVNYAGSERLVANCASHSNNTFHEECRQENEANARLIAAAPELLAACRQAWNLLDALGSDKVVPILEAAIAKAEGR